MNNRSKPGLTLDNHVGHAHLSAEGGEVDNKLDGINIVGDEDDASLLVLDQADNVVQSELGSVWLLANVLLLLAVRNSGGFLGETLLLLGLGLRAVLVEQLK